MGPKKNNSHSKAKLACQARSKHTKFKTTDLLIDISRFVFHYYFLDKMAVSSISYEKALSYTGQLCAKCAIQIKY